MRSPCREPHNRVQAAQIAQTPGDVHGIAHLLGETRTVHVVDAGRDGLESQGGADAPGIGIHLGLLLAEIRDIGRYAVALGAVLECCHFRFPFYSMMFRPA